MGCHTWFYRRLEKQPRRSDLINDFLSSAEKWRHELLDILNGNRDINLADLGIYDQPYYPFDSKEDVEDELRRNEWEITNVENWDSYKKEYHLCYETKAYYDKDTYDKIPQETKDKATLYRDVMYGYMHNIEHIVTYDSKTNAYYVDDVPYHDLFRVYNYPLKKLRSYKETRKYIKYARKKGFLDRKKGDTIYWKELREFWEKHPDGMITFG